MNLVPPEISRKRSAAFLLSYSAVAWTLVQVADVVAPRLGLPDWVPAVAIAVSILGLPLTLLAYLFLAPLISPKYIDKQIALCESAKESLFLCVHSLEPSSADARILTLQRELGRARARGVDVRLMAPGGVDRAEAAFELAATHGVPIRIVEELEDQDLRFTLVDGRIVVLSYRLPRSKGFSKSFAVIHSDRLHEVLRRYFEHLWQSTPAMTLEQYIERLVSVLGGTRETIAAERLSNRLGIPAQHLLALLNESAEAKGHLDQRKQA